MKRFGIVVALALLLSLAVVSSAGAQGGGTIHYVTYGDTLHSIAARYGVSTHAIMRQNGIMNPNMIYAGQPLVIPGGYGPAPVAAGCKSVHVVVPGETLSSIAYRYGATANELARINHLANSDFVYVGQKICVGFGQSPGYMPQPAGYHQPAPAPKPPVAVPLPAPPPAPHPVPPPAPVYGGGGHHGDKYEDMYEEGVASSEAPPAPEFQETGARPLMPVAKHPIEVSVNGGGVWTGDAFQAPDPDPDGDTILIVSTRDSDEPTVWLRSGDYEVKGMLGLVPEFGVDQYRFVFRYIPPGDYDVWFEDPDLPSERVQVKVEPGMRTYVDFRRGVGYTGPTFASPSGWALGDWTNPSKPGENIGGWSNILVRTPASGMNVMIESEGGGYKAKCFTGTKGPGACDFAGLNAGLYWIWIDGTDLKLKTYMDGAAYAEFQFYRQPVPSDDEAIGPVSYSN